MGATIIKRRFTSNEYHRMAQAGILCEDDRVELIDGEIVVMTAIGHRHVACVSHATRALVRAAGDNAIVQPQGSVRLDLYYEPEPDLVLLKPRADFYSTRHRGADDVLLIIEIADSSFEYDRDVKGPIYATAGVPEYWLVNLNTDVVWRYQSPERGSYRDVREYHRGESIAPAHLLSCAIAVDVLLTP
jgi:Uma2 family endonuclease